MIQFTVNKKTAGKRIDKFIIAQGNEALYSRALIERLIQDGKVSINEVPCLKKSTVVKDGDVVEIESRISKVESIGADALMKENIPLDIIYEDKWLAVINKPTGLTVHPGAGTKSGTLVNALLYHFQNNLSGLNIPPQLNGEGGDCNISPSDFPRPGIVHRLDKDTTGLLVIAKDDKTHFELSRSFADRQVKKTYLCLCVGVPVPSDGVIDRAIGRHKTDRTRMAVERSSEQRCSVFGGRLSGISSPEYRTPNTEYRTPKTALTRYKTLIDFTYFSLLEVQIETGRTHQIRVHLESLNHPVLGDNVYNSEKRTLSNCPPKKQNIIKQILKNTLKRQALHSWKLAFTHPQTKQEVSFEAPLPADISETIEILRNNFEHYVFDKERIKI